MPRVLQRYGKKRAKNLTVQREEEGPVRLTYCGLVDAEETRKKSMRTLWPRPR
jgi:hypothetical protein